MSITDIIWDFDGTLFDTYPSITHAFQRALNDENIDEPIEKIAKEVRISVSHAIEYYKEKYQRSNYNFAERFSIYENDIDIQRVNPFPYVYEVCKRITDSYMDNFIFTHRDESVFRYLEYHELLKFFKDVINKEHNLRKKPDPEGYLYIINKHALDKNRVLVVGDRAIDILAAKNAGIKSCLFTVDKAPYLCDPDYRITSIIEILDVLNI